MSIPLNRPVRPDRFDPEELTDEDLREVTKMLDLFQGESCPPALVDERGQRMELPKMVYELLVKVATAIQEGQVITLVPEEQVLTTQAAANLLGVSRPHVIKLIEEGVLPHHKVGAHRRIRMKDLMEFQRQRDEARRESLDEMTRRIQEAGLY